MILFHAAGGAQIGIGHLSRCNSLATELLNSTTGTLALVYEAPNELAAQFAPPGASLCAVASRAAALSARQQLLNDYPGQKHVLITDLLNLVRHDSDLARQQGFDSLVHLNDSGSEYQADIFVDGDAYKQDQPGAANQPRWLRGPRYHIVAPAVASARPPTPWARNRVEKALICFGGADPGRYTELFAQHLFDAPGHMHWTIILGPAFSAERREQLEKIASSYIVVRQTPANMPELILDSDLVVTLGGLTSYEAMCLGRPVAAVAWAHMAHYVARLAEFGLLVNLGEGMAAIEALLKLCHRPDQLAQLALRGWQTIDGAGASRVAAAIRELVRPNDQ